MRLEIEVDKVDKLCDCHGLPMRRKANGKGGSWYCRIKMAAAESHRNSARKVRVVALIDGEKVRRGGHCESPGCDWSATLHWHHRDDTSKKFDIGNSSKNWTASFIDLEAELAKCDLLCPNHHSLADLGLAS